MHAGNDKSFQENPHPAIDLINDVRFRDVVDLSNVPVASTWRERWVWEEEENDVDGPVARYR